VLSAHTRSSSVQVLPKVAIIRCCCCGSAWLHVEIVGPAMFAFFPIVVATQAGSGGRTGPSFGDDVAGQPARGLLSTPETPGPHGDGDRDRARDVGAIVASTGRPGLGYLAVTLNS
jgi:hypothetical protein